MMTSPAIVTGYGPRLTIDLGAIQRNWLALDKVSSGALTGAAVKADGYNLNLNWPTLRHEAWDVAVANQSASWIDDARMRRYSAAYAAQRDFAYALNANLALLINGPTMIDTTTDLRTGSVQPRQFLHVISQMYTMLDQAQGSLRSLQKPLEAALAATPPR